jgi:alpha-tubulin suppressor-like RCC1 family protein
MVQDLNPGDITDITAGDGFTCALFADHSAQCWGLNSNGELGIGNWDGPEVCFSSRKCSTTPRDVAGAEDITQLASGAGHTCALKMDSTVKCWGIHQFGQLGTGSIEGPEECGSAFPNECSDAPNTVPGLANVVSLSTADDSTQCAVMEDSTVMCWGANNLGQAGNGAAGPETCKNGFKCNPTPTEVLDSSGLTAGGTPLADVESVATGGAHSCAVIDSGGIKCWGYKFFGATGDDTWSPTDSTAYTAVQVIGFEGGTPTPTPLSLVWGDLNCNGSADPVDALAGLRFDAGLSVTQEPGCPALDEMVTVGGLTVAWADVDCSGAFNPVDPLKLLRKDAGQPVDKAAGCPEIGDPVQV